MYICLCMYIYICLVESIRAVSGQMYHGIRAQICILANAFSAYPGSNPAIPDTRSHSIYMYLGLVAFAAQVLQQTPGGTTQLLPCIPS